MKMIYLAIVLTVLILLPFVSFVVKSLAGDSEASSQGSVQKPEVR